MNKKILWYLVLIFGLFLEGNLMRLVYDPTSSVFSQILGTTALLLIAMAAPILLVLLLEFIFTGPKQYFARLKTVLPYFFIFLELLFISIMQLITPT